MKERKWFTALCEHISFIWLAFWSAIGMLIFLIIGAPLVAFIKGWNQMATSMNTWVSEYTKRISE